MLSRSKKAYRAQGEQEKVLVRSKAFSNTKLLEGIMDLCYDVRISLIISLVSAEILLI